MAKKLQPLGERYNMSASSIGDIQPVTDNCTESIESMERRLVIDKLLLADFIEISDHIDIRWESKAQTVGSIYTNIYYLKNRIATAKKAMKKSKKKGKKNGKK